jgi:hypothetical protein
VAVGIRGAFKDRPLPPAQPQGGYLEAVVNSLHHAEQSNCRNQLTGAFRALRAYADGHGGLYPRSLREGYASAVIAVEAVMCPGSRHVRYEYVQGLTLDSPPESIIVYEAQPGHLDKCMALRLTGQCELLEPAQLEEELRSTRSLTQPASMPEI